MPGPGDRGGVKRRPKDTKGALRRVMGCLLAYRWQVLGLLLCSFASNIGNLLGPGFAGRAISAASAGAGKVDMDTVLRCAACMLTAYVCSNLLSFLVSVGMMRVGRHVAENLRQSVFDKLMRMPVGYFDRNQAGDIISRVSYDIDVVCTSLSTDVVQIMTSLVTVVGSFVMMCVISPPLVLCTVFTIPASLLFTRFMGRITRPRYSRRSAAYGTMNGFVEEMFTGQKTILAYAHEDAVCDRFAGVNR